VLRCGGNLRAACSFRLLLRLGGWELTSMNTEYTRGNFQRIKGRIKHQWGRLTEEEIEKVAGNVEILASKLQECYGWEREEAERQVRDFSSRHGWQ
jgi:uncharacterized protein YjbJ (UPF0337 family)